MEGIEEFIGQYAMKIGDYIFKERLKGIEGFEEYKPNDWLFKEGVFYVSIKNRKIFKRKTIHFPALLVFRPWEYIIEYVDRLELEEESSYLEEE